MKTEILNQWASKIWRKL